MVVQRTHTRIEQSDVLRYRRQCSSCVHTCRSLRARKVTANDNLGPGRLKVQPRRNVLELSEHALFQSCDPLLLLRRGHALWVSRECTDILLDVLVL